MYPNIPITKPIHPKFIIQHIVASTVRELYKVKWQPRVVLQKKREIEESSLSSIDYAVPCFELSQLVDTSPVELAKEIAVHLATRLTEQSDTDYHKEIESESVSGYVNFRLKQPLISRVIHSSLQWYMSPTHLAPEKQLAIHVLAYPLDSESEALQAAELVYDIGQLLGVAMQRTHLSPDASAEYITRIATQYSSIPQDQSELKRQLRGVIAHELNVEDAFKAKLDLAGEPQQHVGKSHDSTNDTYSVSQQHIAPHVHAFLDDELPHITKSNSAFIFDEANKAVYYNSDSDVVALRSAEGFLYEHAYVLYYLWSLRLNTELAEHTVFFTPHQEHRLIRVFASILHGDEVHITLFDPAVSKLDIAEFLAQVNDVADLLDSAQQYLKDFNVVDIDSSSDRYSVLQVADFSVDALMALESVNMPSFFDIINQLAHLTRRVS